MIKKLLTTQKKSKGQILVMYALMLLVIIAVMGLAVDVGYMYVSYARLRRAVDAAALDASNQIKEGYKGEDLEKAAEQFLRLNDVNDPTAEVRFCNDAPEFAPWHDPSMCAIYPASPRKLVSVTAHSEVPLFFMAALGFDTLPISATAESEAASVDVILVIDISASQVKRSATSDTSDAEEDPYWCNQVNLGSPTPGGCMPFEDVKNAAKSFVENGVYLEFDRVGIVTFSRYAKRYLELTHNKSLILKYIDDLQVDNLALCPFEGGAAQVKMSGDESQCRHYEHYPTVEPSLANRDEWTTNFIGQVCPQRVLYQEALDAGDLVAANAYFKKIPDCNNTNSGAGLLAASEMLREPIGTGSRDEATWVVIFLTDGAANIGYDKLYADRTITYCPEANVIDKNCRDGDPDVRHDATTQELLYDPDDYARDAMDNLFGNRVYLFTIGQGSFVESSIEASEIVKYAEGHESGNGATYFGSGEAELRQIFLAIANRISTRLTR